MGNNFFLITEIGDSHRNIFGVATDPHFSKISSPFLVNFILNIDLFILIFAHFL
jgi:hypothetical protein